MIDTPNDAAASDRGFSDLSATSDDLARSMSHLDGLSKTFGQSLSVALKAGVTQGRSLDTVLRSIGERMSGKALDRALQPLSSLIADGSSSLMGSLVQAMGFSRGGVFSAGRITPFADGGIVSTPTYFPMRGATGLMGEAGAEAILPLRRGPDGRLGVAAGGEGNSPVPHVTLNVTTPDVAGFRRSEAQVTSMLARAVGRGRRGL